ncbi:MAG: hypothetical protein IIB45_03305 [Candidatus Marinimicrobia bacterium]|nr:hypothetical protein [Candidatus Neomarinimicrobiota bacterium]
MTEIKMFVVKNHLTNCFILNLRSVKIKYKHTPPTAFLGNPVQISGMVVDVCPNRGCWIDVSSDKPQEKVDDGVIVFRITAKERKESQAGGAWLTGTGVLITFTFYFHYL